MTASSPNSAFASRDSFLTLSENQMAAHAVEEILAARPAGKGGLVFLSGPAGVGKSLLIRHVLPPAKRRGSTNKTEVITADALSREFAEAAQNKTIPAFQNKYRGLEVFICEDVPLLAGREEIQTQFCALIDEILANGGRVLITSQRPAGDLTGFSRRLINRFHGGVSVRISLPDFESRVKLLNHFASAKQILLPPSVAELLANALPVSPRELSGSLMQLEMLARQRKLPISEKLAEFYLEQEVAPQTATLPDVAKAVAKQFGVPLAGLRGEKRAHGVVLPRQCAMFLARELTDESLLSIAQFFGRRHHSTVVHACKRMQTAEQSEPTLRQHLAQIRLALGVSSCG